MKIFIWSLIILLCLPSQGKDPERVIIPSGELRAIWMAPLSTSEQKVKKAIPSFKISSFEIMKYPVTRKEYLKFLKKHPEWTKNKASSLFVDKMYMSDWSSKDSPQSPATFISWFAAKAYCESLSMRLPTVNEWEYVAAASETVKDANKDPQFLKRILEWYGEPRSEKIKDVGRIYKNVYGVWDMHGLIWEWVEDFNSAFVTGESREDGSMDKNMFCGAGAVSSGDKENYAAFMRFAFRSGLKGNSTVWNLGFRCVKDI